MFQFFLMLAIIPILIFGQKYNLRHISALSSTQTNCTDFGQNSVYCDYNGICLPSGVCRCDDGYITFPKSSTISCNYKQKSRLNAFLFSFFLGIEGGAGEWYLGNENLALGQLLFTWATFFCILIFVCCLLAAFNTTEGFGGCCAYILCSLWCFGIVIWWMCDWIMIINGQTKDGNGAPTAAF